MRSARASGKQTRAESERTMETDTRLIPLTQGKFAVVDAVDYDWAVQWKWYARKAYNLYYANRTEKRKHIGMHREIARRAGLPESREYDHKDHNGLNNRRGNIRPCTRSQNAANNRKIANTTSRFKGVYWKKSKGKWVAQFAGGGRRVHLGYFTNEQEAAAAYETVAKKRYGEFLYQQVIT